jgi:YVTN family beta-propeller protein
MQLIQFAAISVIALLTSAARAQEPALVPDGTIALPDTAGRIDHLAVDLGRRHLFVAELGNGTVDIVDLATRKVIHRISGLKEPQGIGYEPKSDLVAVASGGDGTVRIYSAGDFKPNGVVRLGDDADNVRVDPRNGHIVVGYGDGALAVIDPVKSVTLGEIKLPEHPESFRLSGGRVFVNVPNARQIVVADLDAEKIVSVWKQDVLHSNFPMMQDDNGHVAVVFRSPARLVLLDAGTGNQGAAVDTCGDADDLSFDRVRKRYYVSCGAGVVDAFGADLKPLGRIPTRSGARTSLFVPELDRLFLAERASMLGNEAVVAVLRPQ